MENEIREFPWDRFESIKANKSLWRLVKRIRRCYRKEYPATTREMIDYTSGIGGKIARGHALDPIGAISPERKAKHQLVNRAKAVRRAEAVQRRIRLIRHSYPTDADLLAAEEVVERVLYLIRTGN